MTTLLRKHHVPVSELFRDAAAAIGAVIAVDWLMLLLLEAVRQGEWIPNMWSFNQAVILGLVFAAYAIGWRHPLVGATLVIGGTAAFFSVGYASTQVMPPFPVAWFAAPGVLYLAAWFTGHRQLAKN